MGPYDAWERDAITAREYLDSTVFYEPRPFSHEDFFEAILAQSVPLLDGALSILQELAASSKCVLGVLNNEAREPNDYRLRQFRIRECIDVALSSCYVGLRKPQPAMYRRALDILGAPAERILFIDDRPENVAAASAAGMKSIQFEGAGTLRRDLEIMSLL
jgi:putative hydrolase of the HAD superfamily